MDLLSRYKQYLQVYPTHWLGWIIFCCLKTRKTVKITIPARICADLYIIDLLKTLNLIATITVNSFIIYYVLLLCCLLTLMMTFNVL